MVGIQRFGIQAREILQRIVAILAQTQHAVHVAAILAANRFGVFCCVVLGLALLFIMAQYAMTWLLAPVAITMTLF